MLATKTRANRWSDGATIHGVLAIDYETNGLHPHKGALPFLVGCQDERGNIRMWELHGPGKHGSYDWEGPRHPYLVDGPATPVKRAVENPTLVKLAHNAKFELRMSRALGWRTRGEWRDTMQMAALDNEYQRLGLRAQSETHLGTPHQEEDLIWRWIKQEDARRKKEARARLRIHHHGLNAKQIKELLELDPPEEATFLDYYLVSREHKEVMIRYLEKDLDDVLRLYWYYRKPMRVLYREPCKVETRLVHHVSQMEDDGIRIDVPYVEERVAHYQPLIEDAEHRLRSMAGPTFNANSHPQVKAYLAQRGIRVPSTGVNHLKPFKAKDEFVATLLEYREKTKIVGTFFQALLDKNVDGIIHASFWQNGKDNAIRTGRFSSSDPNLQNIPVRTSMGKEVRRAFLPRVGMDLYCIDYRQIEPRLLAHYAQDETLLAEFISGVDPYIVIGSIIFGEPITKEDPRREQTKVITLAIMYGMGISLMAERLGVRMSVARGLRTKYFQRLPQVRKLMHSCQVELSRYGYVEDIFGRRYRVPRQLSYKSINAKIQGTAAGVMKRAMVRVGDEIERRYRKTLGVKILSQVHDELLIEAPKGLAGMQAIKRCAELMEDRTTFSLPLFVDVEVGCPSWGEKRNFALWERRMEKLAA